MMATAVEPALQGRNRIRLDPERRGADGQTLEAGLRSLIVGQDEAINEIVRLYQTYLAGLTPAGRPIGNLLFLGPTGTGKTRIVEATAQVLTGSPQALIKIDCGEFQHSHEIAKLIGSPPGYLGHRETLPLLSQENLDRNFTPSVRTNFVLFDEIEKASDALWTLLLGILDKATLTLGDNRRVDFSRSMIFMTSNAGAVEMSALAEPRMGFRAAWQDGQCLGNQLREAVLAAARRKFLPEFLNRMNKLVVFKPLGGEELRRVLDIELDAVQQRVFSDGGVPFCFSVESEAKRRILSEGADARYGARHLKRAIEVLVVGPLANLVASGQVEPGDWVHVEVEPASGELIFFKQRERMPSTALSPRAGRRLHSEQFSSPATQIKPARRSVPVGEVGFGE